MNFALLVSNLPDVYHIHHAQYAPQLPAHAMDQSDIDKLLASFD